MDYFDYRDGELYVESVAVSALAAEYSTPLYVYSRRTLERHWHAFEHAFGDYPHSIYYSVKANSNIGVLNLLARLGSGFDVVSGGEIERVLAAGGKAENIVFSGVGKTDQELFRGLELGIACFNVESSSELSHLEAIAKSSGKVAPIAIRVNPDVDAKTHPYISTGLKHNKFGVSLSQARDLYSRAAKSPHLKVIGVTCHIGSQLTEVAPFEDALNRVLEFVVQLQKQGIELQHIDFGGGLGVRYKDETPPLPKDYWNALHQRMLAYELDLAIHIEPGRAIVGNAGILIARVTYLKQGDVGKFCIVDAAMNDLIRPALYDAWQEIIEVNKNTDAEPATYDVVGPICESADFLGKDRQLALQEGDLIAIRTAGAYGAVLSSNYNSRGRAAEVIVDGERSYLVGEREPVSALFAREHIIPD